MKFSLKLRRIEESDLSSNNPFMPDNDDYGIYLNSLVEDIASIKSISKVTQNELTLTIETNCPMDEKELKRLIKPIFTDTIMQNLRFVSLKES